MHSFTKIQLKSQVYCFKIKTSTHFQNLQSHSLGKCHYSNVKLIERNEGTTSKRCLKKISELATIFISFQSARARDINL